MRGGRPRRAAVRDAAEVAALLHDFNAEFGDPSPGVDALTRRLQTLLDDDPAFAALLGPEPDTAVAVVSFRPNPWYPGPVALLDELYVRPARRDEGIGSAVLRAAVDLVRSRGVRLFELGVDEADVDAARFYARHSFVNAAPDGPGRALYFWRQL